MSQKSQPTKRPTIVDRVSRELRRPVRVALLRTRPLPSDRWERLSKGRLKPLGVFPALRVDAGVTLEDGLAATLDEIRRAKRAA